VIIVIGEDIVNVVLYLIAIVQTMVIECYEEIC
jgi:hypothetical protein